MSKIGALREVVDYMTDCPLCGEVSFSIFASSEEPDTRTVIGCSACGVQIEAQLGTLRNDEVRRALAVLADDKRLPENFTLACAVLHRAACVIDMVEEAEQ